MPKTIDYYHFVVSPWSFLAINRFNEIVERHKATVNYKPIDVMSTFANMGGTPIPKRHPSRLKYRMSELQRWSSYLNIKMNYQPAFFPVDASLGSKMVLAANNQGLNAGALSDALLTAVWAEEKNIAEPDTLIAIASACDMNGDLLLTEAQSETLSAQFTSTTQEAHARDVFGSPSYVVDGKVFWGQDRLDFLDWALSM